jgi:hypothetical protein
MSAAGRVLAVLLAEAQRWPSGVPPEERICEYLAGCRRDGVLIGGYLVGLRRDGARVAWCAAVQGWAAAQAEAGEPWCAGALELVRALEAQGAATIFRQRICAGGRHDLLLPGAIVHYTRGDPRRGLGHVERLISATAAGYRSAGGNEGGAIRVDAGPVAYSHPRLRGFTSPHVSIEVEDVSIEVEDVPLETDPERPALLPLAPDWELMAEETRRLVLAR